MRPQDTLEKRRWEELPQRDERSGDAHVVAKAPRPIHELLLSSQLEHLQVVDQVTVRQAALRLEPESLQDLHLGDDEGVFEVVELGGKVVHRSVRLEGRGRRVWRVGAVGNEGGEIGVAVDDVADPEGRLFELRSEEEGAHADVLRARVSLDVRRVTEDRTGGGHSLGSRNV